MFTGLIETTGRVRTARERGGMREVSIEKPSAWRFERGESVAVDGICLTVTGSASRSFSAQMMPETLAKTTGGAWKPGRIVNLERPLAFGDRLHGHLVQGHVEARARVARVAKKGASRLLTLRLPPLLLKNVALHGSITVNGVALTVARARSSAVTLALIPHTISRTNLGLLAKGDDVNVETDFLRAHQSAGRARVSSYATKRKGSSQA